MINVCLCDDNKDAIEKYSELLLKIASEEELAIAITTYKSGEQLLFEAEEKLHNFDVIYMDMLMGRLNGVDTAKALRETGFEGQLVFLTSSKDYMLDAFDATPLHYIVKQETDEKKFMQVFLKAARLSKMRQSESFAFETHGKITRVELSEILFFEVQIRQVYIQGFNERYCFYSKIDDIEKQLSEKSFARCHRSFVVNLQHIRSINNTEILLTNGQSVPVGSKYFKDLKLSFSNYLQSKAIVL